ncbi:MAG: hypothetical protein B7X07_05875 [Actinobacteria bacterium 21-64-8]|nr:MAG: hypothetical protein B7X07_05875 [Actinobacteria bacterium 21-64-8]
MPAGLASVKVATAPLNVLPSVALTADAVALSVASPTVATGLTVAVAPPASLIVTVSENVPSSA